MARSGQSAVVDEARPGPALTDPVLSDQELLAGCRGGDSAAWATLVARYERLVFSTALRQGLGREDAADVTQIAFIALLDGMDAMRDHERLPYWLMTVARRQAWRLSRRSSKEIAVPIPRVKEEEPVDWGEVAALHEAVNQLSPRCRDVLIALYFDASEPTYAEVARRMNRPVGAIGPMRGRCLEHLRQLLAEGETP